MTVFFDVHGTLLSTDDREMRPGAAELLRDLSEAGHEIILWSTAGAGYARRFAERFGLLPWIDDYHSKQEYGLQPDVCVDDHPGYLIGKVGNIRVEPFHGDADDREMEKVRAEIMKLVDLASPDG